MTYLAQSWIPFFRQNYFREIEAYVNCLRNDILPTFDHARLEKEAKELEKMEYERLSKSFYGEENGEAVAEKALDVAISHYNLMNKLKQGLLNLFAVGLYHLLEQQLFRFHRRVLLKPEEENDGNLLNISEVKARLKINGIELERFSGWGNIDELRYLANTIKHTEGYSSEQLKGRRPDFFEDPDLREFDSKLPPELRPKRKLVFPLYQPLMGDGIYVSFEALQSYAELVKSFWRYFADTLEQLSHE